MAERISIKDFEEKVIHEELPVLVDFYSDSCITCKKMAGVIGQIEEEYGGKMKVYKVNTHFEKDLVEKYGILSVPTFLVFIGESETSRVSGVQKKEELINLLLNRRD